MAQFFQDGQTTAVMTIEELQQLYPSIQLPENGGENVFVTMSSNSGNNIDYQHDNQVLIDQSTGQQVQLGYHQQVIQQCHQSQVLTVVQSEPSENGQPEGMETQQIPMAGHQLSFQQQQMNLQLQHLQQQQIQQAAQQQIVQAAQQQQQQIVQAAQQQHIQQAAQQQQQQQIQQAAQQQQQIQQAAQQQQQIQQANQQQHIVQAAQLQQIQQAAQQQQIQQAAQQQQIQQAAQQQQQIQQAAQQQQQIQQAAQQQQIQQANQQQQIQQAVQQQHIVQAAQQHQIVQAAQQQQIKQVAQQQQIQHFQQGHQQQRQQQQYFNNRTNETNGYITQEQVHLQLQPQQVIPMQVDGQPETATYIQAGSQMMVQTGNMLALPGGRKIPLRDWRMQKSSVAVNHPSEGNTVITPVTRPIAAVQPMRNIVQRPAQQQSRSPSYSYRSTSVAARQQTHMAPQIVSTVPTRQVAAPMRHQVQQLGQNVQTITSASGVSYMLASHVVAQPPPPPPVQRRTNVPLRRTPQKPRQPGGAKGRGNRTNAGGAALTDEELQQQADATARFIINTHQQSEANKRLQQQQQQQLHQQELRLQQQRQQQQQRQPHQSVIQRPQMQHRSLLQHQLEQTNGRRQPSAPPIVHAQPEQVLLVEEPVDNNAPVDESVDEMSASLMIMLPNGETMTVDNSQGLPIADVLLQLGFPADNYQVMYSYETATDQPAVEGQPSGEAQPMGEEHHAPIREQEQNITYQTLVDGVIEGEVEEEEEEAVAAQEVALKVEAEQTNGPSQHEDLAGFEVSEMSIVYTSQTDPHVSVETVITSSGKVTTLTQPEAAKQTPPPPPPVVEEPVVTKPTEPAARFVPGFYALCGKCGYLSSNFTKCQRCSRLLPDNPKMVSSEKSKPVTIVKEEEVPEMKSVTIHTVATVSPTKVVSTVAKPPPPTFFVEMPLPRFKKIRATAVRKAAKPKLVEEPVILTLSSDDDGSDSESLLPPLLFGTPGTLGDSMMMVVSSAKKKEPPLIKPGEDGDEPFVAVNGSTNVSSLKTAWSMPKSQLLKLPESSRSRPRVAPVTSAVPSAPASGASSKPRGFYSPFGNTAFKRTELKLKVNAKRGVLVSNAGDIPDLTDSESMKDGSMDGQYTMLHCRTVRIGSYKAVPKDPVQISTHGIRMEVPALDDEQEMVKVVLYREEIVKVLIHFGRTMPVLFVYAKPLAGSRISKLLKMNSKLGPFYDPSGLEIQRRITILPARLGEESKMALKNIFNAKDILAELSHPEANEILVRASPTDNGRQFDCKLKKDKEKDKIRKPRGKPKSLPRSQLARRYHPHVRKKTRQIMVYPPHPETGGITINTEDYACLGGMQFLNDVIIDFYLKYLTLQVLSAEDRKRTHIFSTFFYKRLTTRPKKKSVKSFEEDPKLSPAEKRHARVKSWTKKVNIFDKDFVIIPINENAHWFLAIICFPGLTGPVSMTDDSPVTVQAARKRPVGRRRKTSDDEPKLPGGLQTIELDPPGSDRDEAEEEEEDLELNSDDEESSTTQASDEAGEPAEEQPAPKVKEPPPLKVKPGPKNFPPSIKQPCILIFDSLAGGKRTRVVATLRDYLRIEYKAKMKRERVFDKDTIKGATPKVPQQNNFFDCGLFVLQYVESFFQTPVKDYKIPIRELKCWFDNDIVAGKREEISELLIRLMKENNIDVEGLNLPVLSFVITDSLDGMYEEGEMHGDDGERATIRLQKTEAVYTQESNQGGFIDESQEMGEAQEALIENGEFSSVFTVEMPAVEVALPADGIDSEDEEDCNDTSVSNLKRIVPNQDILVSKAKRKKTFKMAGGE